MSRTITSLLRALIAAAICAPTVFACLNPIGEGYLGQYINLNDVKGKEIVTKLSSHRDRAYWEDVLEQLLEKKRERSDEYSEINHAVALAHLARVKEAIAILLEVERKYPGEFYATAANLGTVYELNGEDEKALKWIKEGFKRNKDGHSGSEWLHVKILETKLILKEEPGFLKSNTVLNIGFDRQKEPEDLHTTDHLGQRRSLKDIESALIYQLHERLEFIKPPEPVVADLLSDLSSIFAITRSPEDSQAVYDIARSYGTPRALHVKPSPNATLPPVAADIPTPGSWSVRSIALGVASVLGLLIVLVLSLRFFSKGNR